MIRPARPDEIDALAAIEAAAAAHPWSTGALAGSLSAGAVALVVDDGGPVGHILLRAIVDEGELDTLAVHPAAQRRGHARRLLHAADAWWRDQGVTQAFLEVRTDNTAAQALYAQTGWVEVGRRRGYYADGCDALLLRRDLAVPADGAL